MRSVLITFIILPLLFSYSFGWVKTTIETDKSEYSIGEPVNITFKACNTGEETVKFEWTSTCHVDYYIDGYKIPLGCYQILTQLILPPDSCHSWYFTITSDIYEIGEGIHIIWAKIIDYIWYRDYTTISFGELRVVDQSKYFCEGPQCDTTYIDIYSTNDTVTFYWDTPQLNTCLEPLWSGWISSDTFYVIMLDTGPPCDCVDYFILTAKYAPFPNGKYTLKFLSGSYECIAFIVDQSNINDEIYPEKFILYQNYPNPFNNSTAIRYDIPKDGLVKITIYNILGEKVVCLKNSYVEEGYKTIIWNGLDKLGNEVPTGVYLFHIEFEEYNQTMKMLFMK